MRAYRAGLPRTLVLVVAPLEAVASTGAVARECRGPGKLDSGSGSIEQNRVGAAGLGRNSTAPGGRMRKVE